VGSNPTSSAMDPLTHTLLGANLASTRLRDTTRFAAAALVIGANLPDVDSILYFTGHDDLARGFRRGWTHGVLALVVLPFVLTALLMLCDRLRPAAGRQVNARWLLGLSALAILTHPFLDWLNNYGMRWLMPFDGRWFYGDAVYIMDPWLWLILGVGWLAPRKATASTVVILLVATALLVRTVTGRAPEYVLVVAIVASLLFLALLWRPRSTRIPHFALFVSSCYVAARLFLNEATETRVSAQVAFATGTSTSQVMAAPHPLDPMRWDFVTRNGEEYRFGRYHWRDGLTLAPERLPVAKPSAEYAAALREPSVQGFVTWMRFPWYEVAREGDRTLVLLHDARYAVRRQSGGFGGVVVRIPNPGN
jgi:inner membrane protein